MEKNPWPLSLSAAHVRSRFPGFVEEVEANVRANQHRPLDRTSPVTLREITRDTARAVMFLEVAPHQMHLVAPNAVSMAQAYFHEEAWMRAIYADETPVGFAMLDDWRASPHVNAHLYNGAPYVALWRFMIDHRFQQHGYGAAALDLLIAHARTRPGAKTVLLSFVPDDAGPEHFYRRFGFTPTGEVDDGEVVMSLLL
jgi:diamine N-acetyltransferase